MATEQKPGEAPQVEIITMQELVDRGQKAMSTMSPHNDHRVLMGNFVGALISLANRLDAAVTVLKLVEWVVADDGEQRCPWCNGLRIVGHDTKCQRSAFLGELAEPTPPVIEPRKSLILMPGGRA